MGYTLPTLLGFGSLGFHPKANEYSVTLYDDDMYLWRLDPEKLPAVSVEGPHFCVPVRPDNLLEAMASETPHTYQLWDDAGTVRLRYGYGVPDTISGTFVVDKLDVSISVGHEAIRLDCRGIVKPRKMDKQKRRQLEQIDYPNVASPLPDQFQFGAVLPFHALGDMLMPKKGQPARTPEFEAAYKARFERPMPTAPDEALKAFWREHTAERDFKRIQQRRREDILWAERMSRVEAEKVRREVNPVYRLWCWVKAA